MVTSLSVSGGDPRHEVLLDAGTPTEVLDELFGLNIESEDFDTLGGLVIHELGRLPSVGDEASVDSLRIKVLSMSGRRIRRLRIERQAPEPAEATPAK